MIDSSEIYLENVSIVHHTQKLKILANTVGMMFAVLVKSRLMPVNANLVQMVKYLMILEEHVKEHKRFTINQQMFTAQRTIFWMLSVVVSVAQVDLLLMDQEPIALPKLLQQFVSLL